MNEQTVFGFLIAGMFVLAGLAVIAIRIHHAGWKEGFERASRIFDDTLCFGCGQHICEACHDKVEMPLGPHAPEAHASREEGR